MVVDAAAIQNTPGGQRHLPGHDQVPQAEAVGEDAGQRRDHHRRHRPRQRADAGLERAEPLHHLEELGQQEDRAERAGREGQRDDVDQAEAARAEQAAAAASAPGPAAARR